MFGPRSTIMEPIFSAPDQTAAAVNPCLMLLGGWCCWSVVHAADCGCGAGGDVDAGAGCDSDVTTLTDQHSVAPQHSMETLSSTSRAVTSHHVAAPARVRQDTGGDQSSEIIRMWCWVDTSDVACTYLQDQHLRQNPKSINFMSDLWKMMDEPNHLFPTLLLTVNSRIRNNWQNQLLLFYGEIFCTKWAELRSQSQFMEMRWKNHQKFVHVFIVMSITNWLLD